MIVVDCSHRYDLDVRTAGTRDISKAFVVSNIHIALTVHSGLASSHLEGDGECYIKPMTMSGGKQT